MVSRDFKVGFTTEIEELLDNIDMAINYLTMEANMKGIPPYSLKHTDGSSALTPLLLAKAHALHTLVLLRTDFDRLSHQVLNEGS